MSDERVKMRSYEMFELISTIDNNLFKPIMEEPDEKSGDYKIACEHLIYFSNFIKQKLDSEEENVNYSEANDTPEELEVLFELLNDVKDDDRAFILQGLDDILFDRIMYVMSRGLENGTITKEDLKA